MSANGLRTHGILVLVLIIGVGGFFLGQSLAIGELIATYTSLFGGLIVGVHLLGVGVLGAVGYLAKRRNSRR